MVTCPKCNAPEHCLRWQFWQGNVFRCTLCDYTFITEISETEYLPLEPESSAIVSENVLTEKQEPLVDVFEENNTIKIYVEVLGEIKNKMRLNVTKDHVEITARNFYKLIDLSTYCVEQEKAYYKYNNCVLEIDIPKKEKAEILAVA
jgi:hypothetical protein